MQPWEKLAHETAADGTLLELRRRGDEYLIVAGGHDLMSNRDEGSSRALADLGCDWARAGRKPPERPRVLVGGLGMGYTLRAALDLVGPHGRVDVAELNPVVIDWNRSHLACLADAPLDDPRCQLLCEDVRESLANATHRGQAARYDAILLDVDNGPDALAHPDNDAIYGSRGLAAARDALVPGGVLGVWSFSDDRKFVRRMERAGFEARAERVSASRDGRGRYHVIFLGSSGKNGRRKGPRGRR